MILEYHTQIGEHEEHVFICVVPADRAVSDLNEAEQDFMTDLIGGFADEIAPGLWKAPVGESVENRLAVQGMTVGDKGGKAAKFLARYDDDGFLDDDDDDDEYEEDDDDDDDDDEDDEDDEDDDDDDDW